MIVLLDLLSCLSPETRIEVHDVQASTKEVRGYSAELGTNTSVRPRLVRSIATRRRRDGTTVVSLRNLPVFNWGSGSMIMLFIFYFFGWLRQRLCQTEYRSDNIILTSLDLSGS